MIIVALTTDTGYLEAFYWGGGYIEICINGEPPQHIINVFDYEKNSPRIKNTHKAVEKLVREWISENWPEAKIQTTIYVWNHRDE